MPTKFTKAAPHAHAPLGKPSITHLATKTLRQSTRAAHRAEGDIGDTSAPLYKDRAKQGNKKNNPFSEKRSLLARYRHLKKPVRDSVAVYNCRSMKTYPLKDMKLAAFRAKIQSPPPGPILNEGTELYPIDLTVDEDDPAHKTSKPIQQADAMIPVAISDHVWPDSSRKLSENENPESVRFPDYGDLDPCDCSRDCFRDVCDNADAGIYCTADDCAAGERCSNSVYDCRDVEVVSTSLGYGVRATGFIPVDTVIGEYTGILTTHDHDKDKDVTSEYAMKLQTRASRRKVYIDAKEAVQHTLLLARSEGRASTAEEAYAAAAARLTDVFAVAIGVNKFDPDPADEIERPSAEFAEAKISKVEEQYRSAVQDAYQQCANDNRDEDPDAPLLEPDHAYFGKPSGLPPQTNFFAAV
ncbi:hypothetical protein PF006_g19393 [Phytophthora fragariae]|uniref:AWS domain-containing protein n=1 Tax=Phytophthora fragariae TaxID=53985 RepID=A0A6A3SDP5_9STRA|nr:hypothetical protein PF003_g13952 [Phytophthora fragariae]KAE9114939.1 hypothetical protein PF006_g19393 [Phytophthora fragariae]